MLTWVTAISYVVFLPSSMENKVQAVGWGVLMLLIAIIVSIFVSDEWRNQPKTK